MVNIIWLLLLIAGFITAAFNGKIEAVTNAIFSGTEEAVKVSLGLIAIMAFWLGVSKIAEAAGIICFLARLAAPVMKKFFPDLPGNHPAISSIMMNFSANVLGLGSMATPFGLAAMKELQKINPDKKVASNAMCTLLALNTASVIFIPSTVIGLRAHAGSAHPAEIIGATFFATACGMTVALVSDRLLSRVYRFRRWK